MKRAIAHRTEEYEEQSRLIIREQKEERKAIKKVHNSLKHQHIENNKLDDPIEPIRREFEAKIKSAKMEAEKERQIIKHEILAIGKLEVEVVELQDKILSKLPTGISF